MRTKERVRSTTRNIINVWRIKKRQRKVFQRKNPEWISLKSRETEFTAKKMQSKSTERKMWTRALKFQNLGVFCYFCRPYFCSSFLVFSTVLVWVCTAEMQPLFVHILCPNWGQDSIASDDFCFSKLLSSLKFHLISMGFFSEGTDFTYCSIIHLMEEFVRKQF